MSEKTLVKIMIAAALTVMGVAYFRGGNHIEQSMKTLEVHGFSNIIMQERTRRFDRWATCGLLADVKMTATAINPAGQNVNVCVCSGVLTGYTIQPVE